MPVTNVTEQLPAAQARPQNLTTTARLCHPSQAGVLTLLIVINFSRSECSGGWELGKCGPNLARYSSIFVPRSGNEGQGLAEYRANSDQNRPSLPGIRPNVAPCSIELDPASTMSDRNSATAKIGAAAHFFARRSMLGSQDAQNPLPREHNCPWHRLSPNSEA